MDQTPAAVSSPPPPAAESSEQPDATAEALRMKSLAEQKLQSSLKSALKYARRARRLSPNLDGIDHMVTALKILRASPSDHYKILRLDPFSPISAIKKQYKSLALALHPDKSASPVPGAEDAFKRVTDSFRFLSDRSNKKDLDLRLRLELSSPPAPPGPVATFWTSCATCRLLHEFDRRYVGHRLVCPVCRKSFLAAEVISNANASDNDNSNASNGNGIKPRVTAARSRSNTRPRIPTGWSLSNAKRKADTSSVVPLVPASLKKPKQAKEKTLAELQLDLTTARKKSNNNKKEKGKEKAIVPTRVELQLELASSRKKSNNKKKEKGKDTAIVPEQESNSNELSLMAVEDSDFYDFDKDRTEKSFLKGQVWAIYDDDDGMPRHYGLITEVLSSKPFKVKMSWLDIQGKGDEALMLGYHVSCGRFMVGRNVDIFSVNFFSHLVEYERAAKEMYRIYPKKGSVWALYREEVSGEVEGRCYDIVLFLTGFNEVYGLSMAYLEKVDGFKTIFKRQEIGPHAVRWLEKDDLKWISHRIPARKVLELEGVDLPKDCWELDPASLPPDLLRIDWER